MNVTAWASGLEVTGDGTGIVSHAGLGLLRRLADKTGLTKGLSQALFSGRLLQHDRGRVLADISCAIADGARAISDFRVLADQAEAFGQVASVPTAYRTLEEVTRGGTRTEKKLTAAVNAARRYAWEHTWMSQNVALCRNRKKLAARGGPPCPLLSAFVRLEKEV